MATNMSNLPNILKALKLRFSCKMARHFCHKSFGLPDLNLEYLCDSKNLEEIKLNIADRSSIGDIELVHSLKNKLDSLPGNSKEYETLAAELRQEALKIPNRTHPVVKNYKNGPKTVKEVGVKRAFDFELREFEAITKRMRLVRTEHLGNVSGSRSYYLTGEMAEIEQALIRYTVKSLLKSNFCLYSVPDMLHREIIENCGMNTRGVRNQVYNLDTDTDMCLSGTSEMALAGFFSNRVLQESELPVRVAAVSRCYRAETSSIAEERGIYRVHEFTKVEMFSVTSPEQSDDVLEEFRTTQEKLFEHLGFHFQIIDMPPHELGAPAYRKYDIEAWLPGRKLYGEVSSCSNCTDYQTRRLGIRYKSTEGVKYAHTVNGTACAVPRMLIALVETFQNEKGTVSIPEALQPLMNGKRLMFKQKGVPELKLVKMK